MIQRIAILAVVGLVVLIGAPCAHAADARAYLDRNTMHMGETVTLNVETHSAVDGQPDFSALAQDFDLLGTQSSQQVNIVNGASHTKTIWAVGLEPKHAGRITIPPIAVGNAKTAPVQLSVLAQPAGTEGKPGDDLFLDVTADPVAPYVQQEVRYTVKLYYAFDLTDGNLSEPHADGVGAQRLGQDKRYLATVGGRRYNVIERHYALTPERSGTLDIPALVFRGNALDSTDPTGFFSRGRSVSARSDAIELDVKPQPAAWSGGPWLPAQSVLLKDETPLPDQVHVGDPITRTIRLQAQGLGFEQLPELSLTAPDGAEMYPDKPDTRTRDDGTWLYGERVRKFAFVPSRPGSMTIPGVTIHWWDTEHDRAETTELAPHTVTVLPAAGSKSTPPSSSPALAPPAQDANAPAAPTSTKVAPASPPSAKTPRPNRAAWFWPLLAAIGFALWLATLALWWRSRRAGPAATPVAPPAGSSGQRAAFMRAAALGELAGAERALVAWARSERSEVTNVGELSRRLAPEDQRAAITALQRARYAGAPSDGIGSALERAFKRGFVWRDAAPAKKRDAPLPELYPD